MTTYTKESKAASDRKTNSDTVFPLSAMTLQKIRVPLKHSGSYVSVRALDATISQFWSAIEDAMRPMYQTEEGLRCFLAQFQYGEEAVSKMLDSDERWFVIGVVIRESDKVKQRLFGEP